MQINASKPTVISSLSLFGINANVTLFFQNIFWAIDPLKNLLDFDNLRAICLAESIQFSSTSQRNLRSTIARLPNFPSLKVFHSLMNDFKDYDLLTSPRDLRFVEAPISLLLDIFGRVYSTDEISRLRLKNSLSGLSTIPSMFLFYFKSTRKSTCGTFRIIPKLLTENNNILVSRNPQLSKTFFSYDWILSDDGLSFLSSLLSILSKCEDSYIKSEKYTDTSIPMFEAYNRTTLPGIFLSYCDGTFKRLSLLAGNTIDLSSKTLGLMIFINAVNEPSYFTEENEILTILGTPTFELDTTQVFYSAAIVSAHCNNETEIKNTSVEEPSSVLRSKSKRKLSQNFYSNTEPKSPQSNNDSIPDAKLLIKTTDRKSPS